MNVSQDIKEKLSSKKKKKKIIIIKNSNFQNKNIINSSLTTTMDMI